MKHELRRAIFAAVFALVTEIVVHLGALALAILSKAMMTTTVSRPSRVVASGGLIDVLIIVGSFLGSYFYSEGLVSHDKGVAVDDIVCAAAFPHVTRKVTRAIFERKGIDFIRVDPSVSSPLLMWDAWDKIIVPFRGAVNSITAGDVNVQGDSAVPFSLYYWRIGYATNFARSSPPTFL